MNVLSVFDGMSCGQIALERAGIKVDNYFASEIDKYAMKVTMAHYPKTVQLGDILNWRSWDLPKIDLLIGGSPCQGFSNAGLGLNFEDPRSKLFFVYVDILKALKEKNPDLQFLLENVKMKKEWQKIITDLLGVEPVLINSALVSAQNRQRLYWANWKIEQPEDKGILLKDIIEHGDVDRDKAYTIDANYFKGGNPRSYFEDGRRQLVFKHQSHKRAMVREECIEVANIYPSGGMAGRIYSPDGKSPSLRTPTGGNSMPKILVVPEAVKSGYVEINANEGVDLTAIGSKTRRGRRMEKKSNALVGNPAQKLSWFDGFTYRKLTPLECERLQTVPECDILQSLWLHIMNLSGQSKTPVSVEILSGRLIKPAGSAERDRLNINVKPVSRSFTVRNPLSEFTALLNADTTIEVQTSQCTQVNPEELTWYVDNAENLLQFNNRENETAKKDISALLNVSINSTEAKIVVNGLVVLHLRDRNLNPLQSGETLSNRYGKEITRPVNGVIYINPSQNTPTMFTTLSPLLLVKITEQIQTILSFYAQNAIDGFTLRQILIDGFWICPIENKPIQIQGYTNVVSSTQRYKMLGNGWTIDVIKHILNSNPNLR